MIAQINRRFLDGLGAERPLLPDVGAGAKIQPLAWPLLIPEAWYAALIKAGDLLMSAQRRILAGMLERETPADVLRRFALSPDLEPLIDWHTVATATPEVLRFDVLLDAHERGWFCEINVDSSVGMAEAHEYARAFATEHPVGKALAQGDLAAGPYQRLAAMIRRHPRYGRGARRLVLLDWSTWAGQGFFDLSCMQRILSSELPDLTVVVADEKSYPTPAPDDFVYRVFVYDDAREELAYLERLRRDAAWLIGGMEAELLSSKLWSAILHDPAWQAVLKPMERAAVLAHVPYTFQLDEGRLPAFLVAKSRFVVKRTQSFGGRGVYLGSEHDRDFFRQLVRGQPSGAFVAQAFVEQSVLPVQPHGAAAPEHHRVVFGLYQVGGDPAGMMVRSHGSKGVINVAGGATVGWAMPVATAGLEMGS